MAIKYVRYANSQRVSSQGAFTTLSTRAIWAVKSPHLLYRKGSSDAPLRMKTEDFYIKISLESVSQMKTQNRVRVEAGWQTVKSGSADGILESSQRMRVDCSRV